MKNLQEVLRWASSFLREQKIYTEEDSLVIVKRLVCYLRDWTLSDLYCHLNDDFANFEEELMPYLIKLQQGCPLQYVIGKEEFFGRNFIVSQATLIPRPETEELVQLALNELAGKSGQQVVEIGVGTGCIIETLALECPDNQYLGVDLSREALIIAKKNCQQFRLTNVTLKESNVFSNVPILDEKYDLVISNPPYISITETNVMDQQVIDFEPHMALFAEEDGLLIYRKIAEELEIYLKPTGVALFEIGYQQGQSVKKLFEQHTVNRRVEILKDLAGLDRMIKVSEQNK